MSTNEEEQKISSGDGGGLVDEELDDVESEEDGDIDDDDEEEDDDDLIIAQPPEDDEEDEEDDVDGINSASPSTSSSAEDNPNKDTSSNVSQQNPTNSATITAAVSSSSIPPSAYASASATAPNGSADETAPPTAGSSPDHKRQRTYSDVPATTSAAAVVLAVPAASSEEKKPPALDDSRRLFQRLWTDGDEIGLLQGFLDYTTQRGSHNSSHHHDTAPFYDQIKTRLQLDFNKNQLVEKLRRLKKKYRNVLSRISSGKEFSFKSPHDQATFEISRKIWSGTGGTVGVGVEEAVLEDEEGNPNPASNTTNCNENLDNNNNPSFDANKSDQKKSRSRKRSRKRATEDNLSNYHNQTSSSIPNVIEDTVRSCLSPLFKELLYCAVSGGPCNGGGYAGLALNPLPLNFGGNNSLNFSSGEVVDGKWRKQQILELEVYSKRIELVQDQIKSALEKLKSMDNG